METHYSRENTTSLPRLGVVSTIWANRLSAGEQFEDLALCFGNEGFSSIEIRDGAYLRNSDFGVFLNKLVTLSERYSAAEWKGLCESLLWGGTPFSVIRSADRGFFDEIRRFKEKTAGITLTYALEHPWMSRPDDGESDDRQIITAKKLAFLFSFNRARMRLVDLSSPALIDPSTAVANLRRYHALAGELPLVQAVENANHSAVLTGKIAAEAGFSLVYDEANLFLSAGRMLEPPERFWESLDPRSLVSVHVKQKTVDEVLPRLGPGRVDIAHILSRLRKMSFTGDLLIENAASDNPLEDAMISRNYLLDVAGEERAG